MFTLAHLSDPHLGPLPRMPFRDLMSKRFLGYINWHRNRGRSMGAVALAALTQQLLALKPDHIAVTGDLVNLAIEEEFAVARTWLETLGPAGDVTVIPGNHDTYLDGSHARVMHHWEPFMTGDAGEGHGVVYPFLRDRGPVSLIGLSSGVATMPFFATGKIDRDQVEAMHAELKRLGDAGRFRVVLIHHPPFSSRREWMRRLIGSSDFRRAIADAGAELVLHGHNHTATINWIEGKGRGVPVVGVPSASSVPGGEKPAATFHLYRIDGAPGEWRCDLGIHRLAETGNVMKVAETVLFAKDRPLSLAPPGDYAGTFSQA